MNDAIPSAESPQAEIYNRIWLSIAERKLRPGTRLKEEQLAEIFSASRARVRQALAALERDGLVTLVPHRGAFVSEPSTDEARDILFARRTIEAPLVARLCTNATQDVLDRLKAHVENERVARQQGDTRAAIRLSGGFHLLLGELAGSPYLCEVLRDLVSRTSLTIAMYQSRTRADCGPDEHAAIVAAIQSCDADCARRLMDQHIDQLEQKLDLDGGATLTTDLKDLLG